MKVQAPLRLTVVTPSFNQGRFLEETIRSVLCQRERVHEYFVIDGGSTDGSADVIRRYAPMIDYWVSEKDSGQSDAIQKGFARATGDVLCWLNSDDVFLPGALKKVHEAFSRRPEWDVVTGYHASIDAASRIRSLHRIPKETAKGVEWGVIHVCQQTCFFKRELYERVGGLNLSLHCVMDTELWFRMFQAGAVWGHIPEFLAGFRQHPEAKGQSWLRQYAEEYVFLAREHPRFHPNAVKRRLGLLGYRLQQALSLRDPRSKLESLRLRGRHFEDVFGKCEVPSLTAGPVMGRDAPQPRAGP